MKTKVIWLMVSCLMVATLMLASCAPAVLPEQEAAPLKEEEEAALPEEEAVTEEEVILPAEEEVAPSPALTVEELKVHFIDVGQGDSILVDLGEIEILIDGGGKSPGVTAHLNDYVDGQLEVIIATHPHADHIGGLIAILGTFDVQEIWHNGYSSTSQAYAQFMATVQAEEAEVHIARRGDKIAVDGLTLVVLNKNSCFRTIRGATCKLI